MINLSFDSEKLLYQSSSVHRLCYLFLQILFCQDLSDSTKISALPRKTHVYGYVSKRTINVTSNATVATITVLFSVAERFAHKVVTLKDVTLNAAVKIVIRGVMGE